MTAIQTTPGSDTVKLDSGSMNRFNTSGPIIFGLAIIFLVFGGFALWASTAPLDSAVLATGVVVVESERKVVQHLEGGIVKDIFVKDGDYVEKGKLILLIDDTRAKSSLEIIKSQLYAYQALAARLIAERDNEDKISFPQELLEDNSPDVLEIINGQQQLFEARRKTLNGQFDILNQRIAQYREQIVGRKAEQVSREEQIALYVDELEGLEKLSAEGNIARNFLLEKKRQLARLKGEEGRYRADVALLEQGIGEAKLQIEQLTKSNEEEIVAQLRDAQENIADLKERLIAARDVLERTRIYATSSGIVIGLSVHTIGAVIHPGEKILEIVPQDEELIFEVKVPLTDIDDVAIGQKAVLRLLAFSFRQSLLIDGEVIFASADRMTDERTGESYYSVRIRVPPEELAKLDNVRLQPGMPVDAQIKTGKRTMLQYIITPVTDILARAFKEK